MATQVESDSKRFLKNNDAIIFQFQKVVVFLTFLKFSFFALLAIEALFSLLFLFYDFNSSYVAIALGSIVLTIFTYFVLLFYYQAKKPEQFLDLKELYIEQLRNQALVPKQTSEHHQFVSQALMRLCYQMQNLEYNFEYFNRYKINQFFTNLIEKISFFCHHDDVFKMQELLLCSAIQERVEQIKIGPTDLEVHSSLAHSYSTLAKLYLDYGKKVNLKRADDYLKRRFELASKRAIEEFEILKEFAPSDPWIHSQLAQCFHSLDMLEEEAKEYEVIAELSPDDQEVLFRLAKIYFKLGKNAQGLTVYGDLKRYGYKRADELLSEYASIKSAQEMELSF